MAALGEITEAGFDRIFATNVKGTLDPDEAASAALFPDSDDSSFVNGSELFVDGGPAKI